MSLSGRAWVSWIVGQGQRFRAARRAGRRLHGRGHADCGRGHVRWGAGTRVEHAFVAAQAEALGPPLRNVASPWPCPNDVYRDRVGAALAADVVDAGLCGVVTAVDLEQAPARFADR
jgi:hypothetical protein